jgi:hypothetical protein
VIDIAAPRNYERKLNDMEIISMALRFEILSASVAVGNVLAAALLRENTLN